MNTERATRQIRVDRETHQKLRRLAFESGETICGLATKILEDYFLHQLEKNE